MPNARFNRTRCGIGLLGLTYRLLIWLFVQTHPIIYTVRNEIFRSCDSHRDRDLVVKTYRHELSFEVPTRRAMVNITSRVEDVLAQSGICEGLILVNAMHITASVFINDDEHGLHEDYDRWLEQLAPHEPIAQYLHNRTGEDNADAHLKRQIMGREVVVAVTDGRLDFGPWEQIFYGEFDGKRRKRVLVKIIGE